MNARKIGPKSRQTIALDRARRSVSVGSDSIELTPREFEILQTLDEKRGRVVSRMTLLRRIWGDSSPQVDACLNVYLHRLRRKIELDPTRPQHLRTRRGHGLCFE